MIVEGISYVQTYRNQFDEILRTRNLDAVIEDLRSRQINSRTDRGRGATLAASERLTLETVSGIHAQWQERKPRGDLDLRGE